ncbi:hypothetical protein RJ640_018366 [Escallonia rubra]|uniref:DUF4219 domain-containing protein n=1 Tax=Escallonia rubra TaxID=112253 RepID=A0AA88SLE3_9ASTE|nr:hypothetical protein RJ640_018366 [Escallonia rubra]
MATKNVIADLVKGEKLNGNNYDVWHKKMKFMLNEQELEEHLTTEMVAPTEVQPLRDHTAYQKWNQKDRSARYTLLSSLQNDLIGQYDELPTCKALWDQLKFSFGGTSTTRLRSLVIKFEEYTKDPKHTMSEHLRMMSNMIGKLRDARHALTDEQQHVILEAETRDADKALTYVAQEGSHNANGKRGRQSKKGKKGEACTSAPKEGKMKKRKREKRDYLYASKLVEENGKFTAEVKGAGACESAKAYFVESYAREHDLCLSSSLAFGDCIADLCMLESVGSPYVLNPDNQLNKVATRRDVKVSSIYSGSSWLLSKPIPSDLRELIDATPENLKPNSDFVTSGIKSFQQWFATELRRREPHDLAFAMVIIERLGDFKQCERPRSPRHECAKDGGDGRSKNGSPKATDDERSGDEGRHRHHKGKKKHEGSRKQGESFDHKAHVGPRGGCFYCAGPHYRRDCLHKGKMIAFLEKHKGSKGDSSSSAGKARMGALQIVGMPSSSESGQQLNGIAASRGWPMITWKLKKEHSPVNYVAEANV